MRWQARFFGPSIRSSSRMHAILKVMGVGTAIPIDQYLRTSFPDLDQEYRDGTLVERSPPDYLHGGFKAFCSCFLGCCGRDCPCTRPSKRG